LSHSLTLLFLLYLPVSLMAQNKETPDQLYGALFTDVQEQRVFPDSKFFTDCIPKREPAAIVADYVRLKKGSSADLNIARFVDENFFPPLNPLSDQPTQEHSVEAHINRLWHLLHRKADSAAAGSSLLPLPYEYVVPGGRFREVYYWDSYFTMLGLKESGETRMIGSMVRNFAWLIDSYGHIPNGNRSYYLSRSQPPFFSLMVELLAQMEGDRIYTEYLPQLNKEYKYWMDHAGATEHVVVMPNGSVLNRYWDQLEIPRQEAWYEDRHSAASLYPESHARFYRDLRSAAESGWDFSSRWFRDGKNLHTIRTTRIIPVDLNCLLVHLEQTIAQGMRLKGVVDTARRFDALASARIKAIRRYCWSAREGWYFDYDIDSRRTTSVPTLAGMFPFFFGIAEKNQMAPAQLVLQKQLLKPGGVVTTPRYTGQQWDAPNGWAPLQWITIIGLERYSRPSLARTIATRWVNLNLRVYKQTGKLTEKYDVVHADKKGGGGEYPTQDGFGWTNGVLLALMKKYGMK
jgi:alpha,alpha-trehalase